MWKSNMITLCARARAFRWKNELSIWPETDLLEVSSRELPEYQCTFRFHCVYVYVHVRFCHYTKRARPRAEWTLLFFEIDIIVVPMRIQGVLIKDISLVLHRYIIFRAHYINVYDICWFIRFCKTNRTLFEVLFRISMIVTFLLNCSLKAASFCNEIRYSFAYNVME